MNDQQGKDRPPQAVIYVPTETDRWLRVCMDWCDLQSYIVVSAVTGGDAAGWIDVVRMMAAGTVDVVVVADRSHLPEGRIPRVEVVQAPQGPAPRQRRPRTIRQ